MPWALRAISIISAFKCANGASRADGHNCVLKAPSVILVRQRYFVCLSHNYAPKRLANACAALRVLKQLRYVRFAIAAVGEL
jgi:hypothetical protein